MRFEEQLLTDNKADQSHSNNVSFGNCYLRIPGSLNSNQVRFNDKGEIADIPPEAEVRIIQYWDGNRPSIKPLLPEFYIWLQDAAARDIDRQMEEVQQQNVRNRRYDNRQTKNTIDWIEKLLQKPVLDDYREYCVWRVLVPYFVNIRRLSRGETFNAVKSWLDKCGNVSRLRFNPERKINDELDRVGDFRPIRTLDELKDEHVRLYTRLQGIVY